VLADQIGRYTLFLGRARSQEGEDAPEESADASHRGDCILAPLVRKTKAGRFAERVVEGRDDTGIAERIEIWIERKEGGVWAVGRAVNPQHRPTDEPRPDDYLFEGYELQDALDAANAALEDDVSVSEGDGSEVRQSPFRRNEVLGPLERWFFGRR
jgi:hypothetical protein